MLHMSLSPRAGVSTAISTAISSAGSAAGSSAGAGLASASAPAGLLSFAGSMQAFVAAGSEWWSLITLLMCRGVARRRAWFQPSMRCGLAGCRRLHRYAINRSCCMLAPITGIRSNQSNTMTNLASGLEW